VTHPIGSAAGAPPPILEVDGLGKSFGSTTVLRSAGLRVVPGRVTALLGRNGVGKTTLFRIVIGRVRAEYGRVMYGGSFRSRPSLARLSREGLMYSAQESALTPHFTVAGHLEAFVTRYGGVDRVPGLVAELEMGEFLDRRPRSLSGGERQRASMALALLRVPSCLLADEPFAGVAPKDRPLITASLRRLAGGGCGVAVSGHDVDDLLEVADHVVWMTGGTTHDLGSPEAAREHHGFRRDYLGPGRGRT
jgi:ABC-type multidrug transport system ATPase subunit